MNKNVFSKLDLFLCVSWGILAVLNLVEFFSFYDYDKLTIAMLQGLLSAKDYFQYKESVK